MGRRNSHKQQTWRDKNEFLHLVPPKPAIVQQRHWIWVEDKLPNDQSYVLAYDGRRRLVAYYQDGCWYEGKEYYPHGYRVITHWMELPDRPW